MPVIVLCTDDHPPTLFEYVPHSSKPTSCKGRLKGEYFYHHVYSNSRASNGEGPQEIDPPFTGYQT